MKERGVFAVARGIWDDPDFPNEPFSEREAFLWLVGEAAWRATKVRVGSATIDLKRGQCAFSTRFMGEKWKWSEARVRRFLSRHKSPQSASETPQKIDAVSDARATLITIRNYDRFQKVGLPTDAPDDAGATQQRRTCDAPATQERRKEETDKHRNIESTSLRSVVADAPARATTRPQARGSRIDPEWIPDLVDRDYAIEHGLSEADVVAEAEKFRDHWLAKPGEAGRKADWRATWRTWCRNAVEYRSRNRQQTGPPNGAGPNRPTSGVRSAMAGILAGAASLKDAP